MYEEMITKQELIDAQVDAKTLEDIVNGPSGELIDTRLGRQVYTLASIPIINAVNRDEINGLIDPKADKVQVAADLSLKADKSTTYTKAETDSLVTPKADKTYVDSAVGAISTDASKQYATLALANADIANIPLNKNIFVSEVANGGYWYKATAGAASLTKSPYDPLTQAKGYTDSELVLIGKDSLENLKAASEYLSLSAGSEFELNPKVDVIIDSQNNILFDIEEYISDTVKIYQAITVSNKAAADVALLNSTFDSKAITAVKNPLIPFTVGASPNRSIKVLDESTLKETVITATGDNYNPRQFQNNAIVYESTNQTDVVGGLYYAQKPTLKEYPLVARKKIAFWGHSFMNDGNMATKVSTLTGFPLYNFGKSGASSTAIAARNGGKKTQYMPVGGSIPASGAVTLTPSTPGPLGSWNNGTTTENLACSFAGIDGVFNWNGTTATFTRNVAGNALSVSQLTDLIVVPKTTTSTGSVAINTIYTQHDECINVIWAARNDDLVTIEQSIANIKAIVDNIKNKVKRVVVMPEFPNSSEKTGTAGATKLSNLNALLKTTFPEFYCEINGVDALQNFKDHYNPNSADDVTDIANGITPRSLRYDNLHPSLSLQPNALHIGADVNAEFIYQFLTVKGWL